MAPGEKIKVSGMIITSPRARSGLGGTEQPLWGLEERGQFVNGQEIAGPLEARGNAQVAPSA